MFSAERELIATLNSVRAGYNTTSGGEGCPGRVRSAAEREKISLAQRLRFQRPEERERLSASYHRWRDENPDGVARATSRRTEVLRRPEMRAAAAQKTREHARQLGVREKTSERVTRMYRENPGVRARISASLGGKPIEATKDGAVRRFLTLSECVRELGLSIGTAGMVLSGKRTHTRGYQLRRVEEVTCAS